MRVYLVLSVIIACYGIVTIEATKNDDDKCVLKFRETKSASNDYYGGGRLNVGVFSMQLTN